MPVIAGLTNRDKNDLKEVCYFFRIRTQQEWVRKHLEADLKKMKEEKESGESGSSYNGG